MFREAAAMVLVRDTDKSIEVCMLRRVSQSSFAAGAYVFPGGVVEENDKDSTWTTFCINEKSNSNSSIEGLSAYKVAAIRETLEEAGLLTLGHNDVPIIKDEDRERLNLGVTTLQEILGQYQLKLNLDELVFYDHWITPEGAPIRFDTRFFLSQIAPSQIVRHDERETDLSCWATPASLLALYDQKKIKLMPVTHVQLQRLAQFDSVATLVESAKKEQVITPILPILNYGESGKPESVTIDLKEGVIEYPVYRL